MIASHPILTCTEAKELETSWFSGDEEREWSAMQQAGGAVADAVMRDFKEIGGFPQVGFVLVLVGKGHNGGDALIAAHRIADCYPQAHIEVRFAFGERSFRPLSARAWKALSPLATSINQWRASGYDLVIDGILGYQFHPPLDAKTATILKEINELPIRLRAAVDLPTGLDDKAAFRADFSYATGIVKSPLITLPNAGRIRCLDLGFFAPSKTMDGGLSAPVKRDRKTAFPKITDLVLSSTVLDPLRALRRSHSDKFTFGHIFIVGGSLRYPGSVLMSVLGALRSGVGLVTAFVPQSLVAAFAARAPEAMWVGWPETPDGGLSLAGLPLLQSRLDRATALVVGSGFGREPESVAVAKEVISRSTVPVVIDADALRSEVVRAGRVPRVLMPHAGEFERISSGVDLRTFCKQTGAVTVLKGSFTRISDGQLVYHSFFGGPVLARGGSGDVLAGLTGGLVAQTPTDLLGAACRGAVWHGQAADALARAHGQVAVHTTQLIDFFPVVLRDARP